MNQRIRVVKVNDEFEINMNRLLSEGFEIYKMFHDKVIMFKDFIENFKI
jgi:hypothetical protein